MEITKEPYGISEELKRKIKNILMFQNIKSKIVEGSIINIDKTNLAYVQPHRIEINGINYLLFNDCNEVFINTLQESIPLSELETHIKLNRS